MLQIDDQQRICDPPTLQDTTITFFSQLYITNGYMNYAPLLYQCNQVVTREMNDQLTASPTMEEVWQITFQMGTTKAPGLDGLNGLFYQKHWEIVKEDLFLLVQNFLTSRVMPTGLNQTIITLIPKTTQPKKLEQYRPISLCNFAYKIISKVLANQLKPWLDILISKEQSTFVKG